MKVVQAIFLMVFYSFLAAVIYNMLAAEPKRCRLKARTSTEIVECLSGCQSRYGCGDCYGPKCER